MYKPSKEEINKLREITKAGILNCQKALIHSEGDHDKAIDFLRKAGEKIAMGRSDKAAKEGLVLCLVLPDNTKAFVFSLNCETDFVAKNEEFKNLAETIKSKLSTYENLEDLLSSNLNETLTLSQELTRLSGVVGEKIEIGSFEKLEAPFICSYTHHDNKTSVLLGLSKTCDNEVGRSIAMHIDVMKPLSLDESSLDPKFREKERDLIKAQLLEEGKTANMIDQIITGKLRKVLAQYSLLDQSFIKDPKLTVRQYLESCSDVKITDFKLVSIS